MTTGQDLGEVVGSEREGSSVVSGLGRWVDDGGQRGSWYGREKMTS